jgi:hypothetical protein
MNLCSHGLMLILAAGTLAAEDTQIAQYPYRPDTRVWLESDVKAVHPDAVIVREGNYVSLDNGIYLIARQGEPPQSVFVEKSGDWLEPVTPPDKADAIAIEPDQIKVIDIDGTVTVSTPDQPDLYKSVDEGTVVPSGSRIRTGPASSAAFFIGGVSSARFTPNSQGGVTQEITAGQRNTTVTLDTGAVFSKVGKRVDEKQDYKVRTPTAVAAARGTDFVTVQLPDRTDVWIAEGMVELMDADGQPLGMISADQAGGLKIIRTTQTTTAQATADANSGTMGAAVAFIPTVNRKLNALRAKQAVGDKLTPEEDAYLARIKRITWLVEARQVDGVDASAPLPSATH